MTLSEVIALLPQRDKKSAARQEAPNGGGGMASRVRDAMQEVHAGDRILGQIRELIAGPALRLGEARLDEMLDILSEQETAAKERFDDLDAEIGNLRTSSTEIRDFCSSLGQKLERLSQTIAAEHEATEASLQMALSSMRIDFEARIAALRDDLRASIQAVADGSSEQIERLSDALNSHVSDTASRFDSLHDDSLDAMEKRIAQWRAEIEDDRRNDMEEVARSLVEIGQRLTSLRRSM